MRSALQALAPGYAALLRAHARAIAEGRGIGYAVDAGTTERIERRSPPLRVLILADNFVGASRIWTAVAALGARIRLRVVFCNNAGQPPPSFHTRLWLSAAVALARGAARSLPAIAGACRVSARPLVDPTNQAWLRSSGFDLGLHGMGVIYRAETISAFRLGILNAHIGHLPGMRGRSVFEWSVVFGIPPCVSTFFVDEGIDTGGPIVERLPAPDVLQASSLEEAKRRLFALDAACYRRTIERLLDGSDATLNQPLGPRFYAMSAVLRQAIVGS